MVSRPDTSSLGRRFGDPSHRRFIDTLALILVVALGSAVATLATSVLLGISPLLGFAVVCTTALGWAVAVETAQEDT